MIVQQALFEGRRVSVALPPIRVLFPLRAPRVISPPSAFLLPPLHPVNPVNPVKTSPYPHHLLRTRVSDTMAVRQNTMRKSTFLPERGRPARLPHGRCRMRCPVFGKDTLLRVRRRCGILPRRFVRGRACRVRHWILAAEYWLFVASASGSVGVWEGGRS